MKRDKKIDGYKKHMMVHFVMGVFYMGGAIWGAAVFLMFLIKDTPMTWDWLWPLGTGVVGALINMWHMIKKV